MTDSQWHSPEFNRDNAPPPDDQLSLPDDLPPVQPPSAGMIVQLFLVPAVIVAVIVGVYALFGRMAAQELDWRQQVRDVSSTNPTLQGRGALGLAQILEADARRGSSSQHLAANPEIATALSDLYRKLVPLKKPTPEELNQLEYLSKALGRLESVDIVAPVLRAGIEPQRQADVRKHSLIGLAMLAGTAQAAGHPVNDAAWTNDLINISRESEPLFRHQAAFSLGLMHNDAARERLKVLLDDADRMTRVNAAIGLARQGSLEGLPVFRELLDEGISWKLDPTKVKTIEEESTYFERMLMLTNAIKAIRQLSPELSASDRKSFTDQLEQLAAGTNDAVLRTDAREALHLLQKS